MEQVEMADLTARVELLQRKLSGQYEEEVMQAAQALVEQQMQQAQEQQAAQGQAPGPAPGPSGQQSNPAQGGIPPSVATPEGATFEGATGTTRTGEQVVVPEQGI